MGEIRFAFEGRDTEELLREANYKVRMRQRWQLGVVLLLVGLVELAVAQLYHAALPMLIGLWILISGVYYLLVPMLEAKRFIRYTRKQNDGQVPGNTVVIADKITFTHKENVAVTLFADVKSVHFLNRGMILWGNEWIFTFAYREMTGGTLEELEQYLHEKCKNAKFYHRESKKFREEMK